MLCQSIFFAFPAASGGSGDGPTTTEVAEKEEEPVKDDDGSVTGIQETESSPGKYSPSKLYILFDVVTR